MEDKEGLSCHSHIFGRKDPVRVGALSNGTNQSNGIESNGIESNGMESN